MRELSSTASAIRKRKWRRDKPELYLKNNRETAWRSVGIDVDRANHLRDNTDECELCGFKGKLHVDHCHNSLQIRGMLCSRCNRGLGFFSDNPTLLRKAADYLEKVL